MATYSQVEFLLKYYPIIKAKTLQRGVELDNLLRYKQETTKSAAIEELTLASRDFGELKTYTGRVSDVTSWVALNYDLINSICYGQAQKQVIKEIRVFGNLALKAEIAIKGLEPRAQRIIKMAYWEKKTWGEIGKKLYLDKVWCQTLKRNGIRAMQKLITLDATEIDFLLKLAAEGEPVVGNPAREKKKGREV